MEDTWHLVTSSQEITFSWSTPRPSHQDTGSDDRLGLEVSEIWRCFS